MALQPRCARSALPRLLPPSGDSVSSVGRGGRALGPRRCSSRWGSPASPPRGTALYVSESLLCLGPDRWLLLELPVGSPRCAGWLFEALPPVPDS